MTAVERFGVGATIEFQADILKGDGTPEDISGATAQDWIFEPPANSGVPPFTKAGTHVSDGTDGKSKYQTVEADLSVIGRWRRQCIVRVGLLKYPTEPIAFEVFANLA